jgi:hypothetical protein
MYTRQFNMIEIVPRNLESVVQIRTIPIRVVFTWGNDGAYNKGINDDSHKQTKSVLVQDYGLR